MFVTNCTRWDDANERREKKRKGATTTSESIFIYYFICSAMDLGCTGTRLFTIPQWHQSFFIVFCFAFEFFVLVSVFSTGEKNVQPTYTVADANSMEILLSIFSFVCFRFSFFFVWFLVNEKLQRQRRICRSMVDNWYYLRYNALFAGRVSYSLFPFQNGNL